MPAGGPTWTTTSFALALVLATAACGGSDPSPAGPPATGPASDTLDCTSGYSSGGSPDYFGGGGETTAAEAITRAEAVSRAGRGAARRVRLVESTEGRARAGFVDPAGTVTGNATVVRVDGRWQIEAMSSCTPVGSVGVDGGP